MPITPTEKIWMNGELVDWDDARIHILTHTLHYGMGVFEGIRAYETDDGPGIFRLTDHIERLFRSAAILGMEIPYSVDELVQATKDTVASTGLPGCYIRPIAYYGYGEMGLNTLPCTVDVSIACWPWGAYLGDDALTKGVRMKISSWTRHDHNTMPPASKTTGNYVNSSLAKVEALKAGYDEAIMLNPQGFVSECTGENIFVARHGRLITPPLSAGALEGITQDTVIHLAEDMGFEVRVRRPHPQRPLRRRGDVRGRHRRRGERGQLGRRPRDPVPRPDDQGDRRGVRRGRPRQGRQVQDWVELCRHDASLPSHVEIFDTTLRDGAQFEGISLTVEDKLKVAEQLDWLGVAWIEGGYPQANPKDEEFFRRAVTELELETATLVAFGSTRRPGRQGRRRPHARRRSSNAGTSTVCIVGKSWDFHVDRGARHHPRRGRGDGGGERASSCKAAGLRVFFDAEHFFDGYKANPEYALRVLEAAATNGADVPRAAATPTAARCRTRCSASSPRCTPTSATSPSASTPRTTPAARWPTRSPPCVGGRHPAPGHGQRLRRAHRQRQPHDLHPEPRAEDGHPVPARGPARAPHRGEPPRGRAGEPAAALRRPVRRPESPSPTRAGCTPPPSARPAAPPTSTSSPRRSATAPACW